MNTCELQELGSMLHQDSSTKPWSTCLTRPQGEGSCDLFEPFKWAMNWYEMIWYIPQNPRLPGWFCQAIGQSDSLSVPYLFLSTKTKTSGKLCKNIHPGKWNGGFTWKNHRLSEIRKIIERSKFQTFIFAVPTSRCLSNAHFVSKETGQLGGVLVKKTSKTLEETL